MDGDLSEQATQCYTALYTAYREAENNEVKRSCRMSARETRETCKTWRARSRGVL